MTHHGYCAKSPRGKLEITSCNKRAQGVRNWISLQQFLTVTKAKRKKTDWTVVRVKLVEVEK